jgi:hypothetical protein
MDMDDGYVGLNDCFVALVFSVIDIEHLNMLAAVVDNEVMPASAMICSSLS